MMTSGAPTMERAIAAATESDGGAPMRASSAERAEPARAPSSFVGINRWIALAAALLLHGAILAALLIQFDWGERAAPPAQEIPVEVVVEQPKPPEPQPQPQPQPSSAPPPQLDLKPAHDAPRAVSEEKTPAGADAKTNGEKSPTPDAPQAGATPAPNEAAKAQASSASPPAPAPAKNDGELQASDAAPALDAPADQTAEAPDSQVKVAAMIGQPLPTWSKGKQYSTFDPVPDVQFGAAAASPVGGGQAPTTYLTIVYGLVMQHLRLTDAIKAESQRLEGAINFSVDGHGDVIQRSVAQPSGSNALDAAALAAVTESAPYPPPPMGLPIALKFTYGGKQ
jgi:protein TonB